MPIYEYECPVCGRRIERFCSYFDEPVVVCENCDGGESVVVCDRVISNCSVSFKGDGWTPKFFDGK